MGIDNTMAHPNEGIHEKSDFLGGDANIQRIILLRGGNADFIGMHKC